MAIKLSSYSETKLKGVKTCLVAVVRKAAALTPTATRDDPFDWRVGEGLRTKARQRQLVAAGASRTMASKHLTGDAVDLHALIGSNVAWDWPLYYRIARHMRDAARALDTPIVWGGVWDRDLRVLGDDMAAEVRAYCARHAGSDFIDGPHYQLG